MGRKYRAGWCLVWLSLPLLSACENWAQQARARAAKVIDEQCVAAVARHPLWQRPEMALLGKQGEALQQSVQASCECVGQRLSQQLDGTDLVRALWAQDEVVAKMQNQLIETVLTCQAERMGQRIDPAWLPWLRQALSPSSQSF